MRLDDYKFTFQTQPDGWLGNTNKPDVPTIVNLRLDPFERTAWQSGNNGSFEFFEWYKFQFWRFVFVQQKVLELAQTAIDFPPMQKGASFGLSAVKAQIEAAIKKNAGQ